MVTIGLTGPIGHGKTTLADAFARVEPNTAHLESSLIISEVATAMHERLSDMPPVDDIDAINRWLMYLPDILHETVHTTCSYGQIAINKQDFDPEAPDYSKLILHLEHLHSRPALARQPVTPETKENHRPFLQWLGGYLVKKVDKGIWYDEIVRRIKYQASTGTRLCIVGGLRFPADAEILRRVDAKIIEIIRPTLEQSDTSDPTERERRKIIIDATIINDGSIDDLETCANRILDDIRSNNMQPVYKASEV